MMRKKGRGGVSDVPKYPTLDEREPSACAKRTEDKKGGRYRLKGRFWTGMNSRDETDPVTRRPVGRGLTEGFRLLADDEWVGEHEKY